MRNSKTFMLLALAACVFFGSTVSAGTAVVGFEIGSATRNDVEDGLKALGLEPIEGSEMTFSFGKPIVAQGPAFGIASLTETCFAFDPEGKLGFVGMLMDPDRFDHMDKILEGKYTFLERHGDESGSRCAHYESEDAVIDLIYDAGTPLQLLYIRKDVRDEAEMVAKQKAEEAAKKEATNF
jgi:hypothetical protein